MFYLQLEYIFSSNSCTGPHSAVGNVSATADPGVASLIPAQSNTFVELDHEISSTSFPHPPPPLPLIQEGLSVTSESMCTKYW